MKKIIWVLFILIIIAVTGVLIFAPAIVDSARNAVVEHAPYTVSGEAKKLHQSLIIGDWHADSLLWNRDLSKSNKIGQLDIPRMQKGNVGLQVMTVVTKSPSGQNLNSNETATSDNITKLALVQRWPVSTWTSLTARAVHQAKKLDKFEKRNSKDLMIIKSKSDLTHWQNKRQTKDQSKLVGALLGTEGSHALDGKLENVQLLYDHGFRMMSLHHFFDNKLGGSLHGVSQGGLHDFGRQVVKKINDLNIVLDVSHSSEAVVNDVLNMSSRPVVVSHTGFKGHCNTPRNVSDALMQKIAADGGLIGVGYWASAICGTHPSAIAGAIKYGIELVGENHVALGSDFDGSVTTGLDTSELVAITQALMDKGISEPQIRKVMGGNMLRFLIDNLPE